jgi:PAS domain S-box-containing protein
LNRYTTLSQPLRVLLVEAASGGSDLLVAALRAGGFEPVIGRADSAGTFSEAVSGSAWDVILSDIAVPGFGAAPALAILRDTAIDIPLIVVSDIATEDRIVDMMRAGACDYVRKQNLTRLPPAVMRELTDGVVRREQRRADDAARRLADIVQSSSDPIISETLDGVVTSWNESAELLYGWNTAESVGRNISFLVPADRVAELESVMARIRDGVRVYPFETIRLHKDGRRIDVEATISPIRDRRGALVGISKAARDIGEKKRAEAASRQFAEALQTSEDRFRLLVETIPHMVWMAGPDGTTDFVNERAAAVLGDAPDAIHGSQWLNLLHPDDRTRSLLRWEQAVRDEGPYSNEYRIRVADGTYRWYLTQAIALRGADGLVARWVGTWTDIDDRRRAEDRRVHDAALLAQVRDSVIVTDVEGNVTYWNRGATELFGWAAAEMLGHPLALRFPESVRDGIITLSKGILAGADWSGEFEDYRKDGSRVWIDARVTSISDAAGIPIGVMGVSHDISGRKAAESALRESEQRFRQIAESISEVFWLNDFDGRLAYVSPAYEEIWGRTCESFYASPTQWMEAIHEDDRERVSLAFTTRAGTYDEQYRIVRPDGAIRWIRDRGFPVRAEGDRAGRIAGVAEDITERLQLEAQLRQAQKMEAVGQLAGGVAHDFNNLLTVITGYSELLLDILPVSDDPARQHVAEIMRAGERSAALTGQLLALSRKQVLAPTVLDLNEVVRGAEKLLRRVIGEDVLLRSALPAGLGCVVADAGQLEQVLLNLALNARDAMPLGGTLVIETLDVEDHPRDTLRHPGLPPGRYVALEITDSGTGMSADVTHHLFEPFFTTKDPGKGTGLGLAVVHGFVKQSGGHIGVESEVGRGTTFRIYLPRAADPERPAAASLQEEAPLGGGETILVVEDDDAVRLLSKRTLERFGYRVLESSRGDAALQLAGSYAGPIDLLVTDVVMPGGGGRVVAEQLRAAYPAMSVLYSSGYTDEALLRNGVLRADVNFLQKPFTPAALATTVRAVLDRAITR